MNLARAAAASSLLTCASLGATTTEIGPGDDLAAALNSLHAGDTLLLDAGTYTLNGYVGVSLQGTNANPIVIRAQAGAHPLVTQLANQNIINFISSTFVTIDGIEFTGGSIGLRFQAGGSTPTMGGSDITVQNCHVHATPANAIAANSDGNDYARFRFIHNEIDHTGDTGEGLYLGCNNDGCRFHDSLVANNHIHDLNGATITQGDGIEIKQGSYANVVEDNVIHDTGYPGITMYDLHGEGGGAVNIIQRNIVWNTGDNGIQVTADAIVRNNIVLSECAGCNAFASNNVQGGSAANLVIANNTLFAPGSGCNGIKLNAVSGSVMIANNAIYATGNAISANGTLTGVTVVANAGTGSLNGVSTGFDAGGNVGSDFFGASLSGTPPQNLIPKGSLLPGMANAMPLPIDDFDGHPRSGHLDIGAYGANTAGTPGWTIQGAFKVLDEIFFDGFGP